MKKAISIVLVISLLMVVLTGCTPWQRFKDAFDGVGNDTTTPTEDVTNPTEGTTPDNGDDGTTTTEPTESDEQILEISPDTLTIEVGKDGTFNLNHQGGGTLIWKSSNENVATVSANGVVHAKSEGVATITVSIKDTDISDSGVVKVVKSEETEPTAPSVDNPTDPTEETKPEETEPKVSLFLNKTYISLEVGDTYTLKVTYSGASGKPTWGSYNPTVATVDSNGKVTAKGEGTATIAVKYGGSTVWCTVEVHEVEATEPEVSVKLDKRTLSLDAGKTYTLKATTTGNATLSWTSSNSSVATVDSNGKVTAKGEGSAVITASYGKANAQCVVTVNAAVSVKLDKTSLTLDVGETYTLTATTTGNATLSWTSSNSSVATVSNGKVTAKGAGTATITVKYGSAEAKCTVTVNKVEEPTEPAPTNPPEVTLKLNKRTLELDAGDTYTLVATYSGASGKPEWSSSDASVASVDPNGKVTAKTAGTAVIKATYGGKTAQCVVEVYAVEETEPEVGSAESVWKSSNNGSWSVGRVGNYLGFSAGGRTADGVNMGVTATSSNTGVASVSVSDNGSSSYVTVSFKGAGTVTITLTSVDGEAKTSFTIDVKNYSSVGVSSPQDFVNAVNSVVQQNGCSVVSSGAYTVLTLSDAQLSWGEALGQGQSLAHRAFSSGGQCAGCSYQGIDPESGEHIFYLHSY